MIVRGSRLHMKKMMLKGFTAGLVLIAVVLIPACRSSRKPAPTQTSTAMTDTVPDVSATTTQEAVVTPPEDFVREDPRPIAEERPRDVEALNRYVQERGHIRDAFFGYDESMLSADAQAALTSTANWLRSNPQYNLLIEGHTDERGTEQYNLALGDRRAHTVREFLSALGVDTARMRTVSYGEERPFASGSGESAWSQNRRAHLVIVGTR